MHSYGLEPEVQLGYRHEIEFAASTAGTQVASRIDVNSIHQQAISHCPEGFAVTARAADGTIEAIESTTDWYAAGVQWHPEKMCGADEFAEQEQFVAPFVDAVENYRHTTR
ncbi:gamma-glutamyl-gamma-aminobutyrate hydrolase family protein [Prescottella defluvii]|nr:gamma-glutamyl-gamma-aminobutyrate hydrolase family protein [Prescottella defluvii]